MSTAMRFWRLLDTRQRWTFGALQGLCVVMAVSTLVGIAAVIPFFAVLGDPEEIARRGILAWSYEVGGFESRDAFVTALGVAFIALILLANAVNMVGATMLNRFAFAVGDGFRLEIFEHNLLRGISFHASRNSATLVNNLIYEVDRVTGYLQSLFALTSNGIVGLFIVATAAVIDPGITVLAVAILGGSYVVVYALTRRRLTREGGLQSRFAAERAMVASEAIAAIKELTVWGAQRQFLDRFAIACRTVTRATAGTQNLGQQPRYIFECLAVGGLVAAALVLRANEGRVASWLPQLTFLGFAAYRLLPALQQIFQSAVRMRANFPAFERVEADLVDARSVPHEGRSESVAPLAHAISVKDVSFTHERGRPPALRRVSFDIPRGSMVGIVGANGSGKTTLIEVLLGLLHPESGTVAIDGQPLARTQSGSWQSQLAYVPQNIVLLDGTIVDNIVFNRSAGPIHDDRLALVVRAAGLEELIASLPNGLMERIGERGVRLSGGERQRVGIARALYRDSGVLVLDEATSALDARSEEQIVHVLGEQKGRRTIILVAHRLTTLRACDLVLELERGAIIRRGTYDELRRSSTLFRPSLATNAVRQD